MYADLHPDADWELSDHALYYERREPGLGARFIEDVEASLALLLSQPLIGQLIEEEFRLFVLDEFPFSLIYRIEQKRILIVAIAHQSRRPGYWQERILPPSER